MKAFQIFFTGRTEDGQLEGKLVIGDHVEAFLSRTDRWDRDAYEAQWREGVARIASGHSRSCLITAFPPAGSPEPMEWWVLYRMGEEICLQNHLRAQEPEGPALDESEPWRCVPPRVTHTESGKAVSEWRIRLDAFGPAH